MKFVFSSQHRISGTSSKGVINCSDPINGCFFLELFVMTDRIYNVSSKNNQVYINSYNGATPSNHTLTLSNGYYTETQLKDELSTQLNTISGNTYTVTYNAKTAKYTISETSGDTFKFTWGSNTSNSARKLLGFSENTTAFGTSHTSDICVDLCPYKVLYCSFDEVDRKGITTTEHSHTDFFLTGESNFGGVFRWSTDKIPQFFNLERGQKKLHYRFHTIDNADIDLNGLDWEMIFRQV